MRGEAPPSCRQTAPKEKKEVNEKTMWSNTIFVLSSGTKQKDGWSQEACVIKHHLLAVKQHQKKGWSYLCCW